jgi:hypothetical protein
MYKEEDFIPSFSVSGHQQNMDYNNLYNNLIKNVDLNGPEWRHFAEIAEKEVALRHIYLNQIDMKNL